MAQTMFDSARRTLGEALDETADLLNQYGPRYDHWAIAYSGGKDSSACLTALAYLIDTGRVSPPKLLSVRYADTRMELPPLKAAADAMLARMGEAGHDAECVLPAMDDRFFVYMLGRGVPPPSNTFRWCTDQLKIEPMERSIRAFKAGAKVLMLTGVRLGESAARDDRIAVSCSRDGAECGQGRIHLAMAGSGSNDINQLFIPGGANDPCDTLAPILHWRVCHVWNWLLGDNAESVDHDFLDVTGMVADAYGDGGGSKLIESAARTGCVGCNLASRDVALDRLCRRSEWAYLAPLKRLRPLYAELKEPANRLRKSMFRRDAGGGLVFEMERRKDGTPVKNPGRLGPITFAARRHGLATILDIQAEVCRGAERSGKPPYSLIDPDEERRIGELIDAETWPNKWDGTETIGDAWLPEVRRDGTVQHRLFGE